jgi:hypothetical protein
MKESGFKLKAVKGKRQAISLNNYIARQTECGKYRAV